MKINILSAGKTPVQIENEFGTTGEWVYRVLPKEWDVRIINYLGGSIITDNIPDVWVLAGSFLSVTGRTKWMQSLIKETRKLLQQKIPVLGICFGHQLLAASLGGRVISNPNGLEIGFSKINLTDAGGKTGLYQNIPNSFFACQSHADILVEPPGGSVILAKNAYGIQSVRFKEWVYGVQFHPECYSEMVLSLTNYFGIVKTVHDGHEKSPDLTFCRQVLLNFFNVIRKEKNNAVTAL